MYKKRMLILLAVMFLVCSLVPFSYARLGKDSKIKRSINELSDRRLAGKARTSLTDMAPKSIPYLQGLALDTKKNSRARILAINVLGNIGDSTASTPLMSLLKDREMKVRRAIAKVLGVLKNKEAVKPLLNCLSDYDPDVRFLAVRSLQQIGDTGINDVYISLIRNPDPRIRLFSVIALGKIKDPKSVESLSVLTGDWNANVRMALARTLGNIGTKECLPILEFLIQSDPDIYVRAQAVENVGGIKGDKSTDILLDVANRGNQLLRYKATLGLIKLKDKRATGVLVSLLNDESIDIRVAAIYALGALGTKEAKEAIRAILDDESSNVRKTAKKVLG